MTSIAPSMPSCESPADDSVSARDPGSPVSPTPGLNAQILKLAVPALGALLAEPTFLLVDAAIVGHLVTEQLSGVGISSVILATL